MIKKVLLIDGIVEMDVEFIETYQNIDIFKVFFGNQKSYFVSIDDEHIVIDLLNHYKDIKNWIDYLNIKNKEDVKKYFFKQLYECLESKIRISFGIAEYFGMIAEAKIAYNQHEIEWRKKEEKRIYKNELNFLAGKKINIENFSLLCKENDIKLSANTVAQIKKEKTRISINCQNNDRLISSRIEKLKEKLKEKWFAL